MLRITIFILLATHLCNISNAQTAIELDGHVNDSIYFNLGLQAYHQSKDLEARQFFEKAIKINNKSGEYFFYHAMSNLYLRAYPEAEKSILKAIKLKPKNSLFHIAAGDIYYDQQKFDRALLYYMDAKKMPLCEDRAYVMCSQIYADQKDFEKAIPSFRKTLTHIDPFSQAYVDGLYNLGMIFLETGQFQEALEVLSELVDLRPLDFEVMAKIVQCHYANNDTHLAEAYREKIYAGHENNLLPSSMKDMFCFDQFMLDGHKILAFEYFKEPVDKLYFKHVFYVLSPEGQIKYSIQTEHSSIISSLNKKYVLGKTEKGDHVSYFEHLFDQNFEYAQLKNAVIEVFSKN